MGLIQTLVQRFARSATPVPATPVKRHALGGYGAVERDASGIWAVSGLGYGASKLILPFAQHATVYNAVNQTARNLSGLKLEFFQGNTDEAMPPTDKFVRAFWNAVRAGGMTQRQFVAKHAQDLELTGDWFLILEGMARTSKLGSQLPAAIYRVPRSRMTPNVDQRTGAWDGSWKYATPSGYARVLSQEEVVHSFYPSPYDDRMGIAPLQAALMEADSDYAAMMWNRFFFENDTSSGVVFQRDKDAFSDPTADKQFMEWWNSQRRGVEKVGNAVLPPPGTTVEELGATQREMSFPELREYSREQILAVLGVPPPIAGIFADATLANITQALRFFWYNKLFPMADDLEATLQSELLDRFNTGVRCAFKREDVQALIDDYGAKLETAKSLWAMGVPFEKINDRLDLGFNTDEIEGSDIGFVPSGVVPIEQALEPPPEPQPFAPAPGQQPAGQMPPEAKPKASAPVLVAHAARARRYREIMEQEARAERPMLAGWRSFIRWAGTEAISAVREMHHAGDLVAARLQYAGVRVRHDDESKPVILPSDDEVVQQANRRTSAARVSAYKAGRKTAEADLDRDLTWTLLDRRVLKANQDRAIAIKNSALNERERIRATVDEGIQSGASVDDIEKALRTHMNEAYVGQARVVAQTETLAAFGRARFDAFGEAGVTEHEWLSAGDADVRESHRIDGERRPMGSAFSNGLFYPMDPAGPPEETINCRCVALPVVE